RTGHGHSVHSEKKGLSRVDGWNVWRRDFRRIDARAEFGSRQFRPRTPERQYDFDRLHSGRSNVADNERARTQIHGSNWLSDTRLVWSRYLRSRFRDMAVF